MYNWSLAVHQLRTSTVASFISTDWVYLFLVFCRLLPTACGHTSLVSAFTASKWVDPLMSFSPTVLSTNCLKIFIALFILYVVVGMSALCIDYIYLSLILFISYDNNDLTHGMIWTCIQCCAALVSLITRQVLVNETSNQHRRRLVWVIRRTREPMILFKEDIYLILSTCV
jgi:hypothetical protein